MSDDICDIISCDCGDLCCCDGNCDISCDNCAEAFAEFCCETFCEKTSWCYCGCLCCDCCEVCCDQKRTSSTNQVAVPSTDATSAHPVVTEQPTTDEVSDASKDGDVERHLVDSS